jgi:hypothetical protein
MKQYLILIIVAFILWNLISCQHQIKKGTTTTLEIVDQIDTTKIETIELPRPNSGTYSFEDAENRKDEIYKMQLSVKYFDWINPTTGGAIHINKQDEIEVYKFTMGMMYLGKGIDKNGKSVVYLDKAPKDTVIIVKKEDLKHYVGGIGFGNPASVLITSEYDLKKSKSIELILDEVFEPGIQIYYLKNTKPI